MISKALSAFETRLDEKRPFFVESGNFFKGPQNITHTRRIGQRPGYYETDDEIISQPNSTTILGAFKLIGQFENGIQYGMLNAFTDREYARVRSFVDSVEIEKDFLLEPYKNYNMSVVQIPVFNERSITKINVNNLKRENENFITTYSLQNEFSFFRELKISPTNINSYSFSVIKLIISLCSISDLSPNSNISPNIKNFFS